jgi:hypothetical protein
MDISIGAKAFTEKEKSSGLGVLSAFIRDKADRAISQGLFGILLRV